MQEIKIGLEDLEKMSVMCADLDDKIKSVVEVWYNEQLKKTGNDYAFVTSCIGSVFTNFLVDFAKEIKNAGCDEICEKLLEMMGRMLSEHGKEEVLQ